MTTTQDIDAQLKINRESEEKLLQLFDYVPQWKQYPVDDCKEYYWRRLKDGRLYYSTNRDVLLGEKDDLSDREGLYSAFLHYDGEGARLEFRKADRALIVYDTQCDGNVYLGVWDTTKEVVSQD